MSGEPEGRDAPPREDELTPQEVGMLGALIRKAKAFEPLRDFEVLILARAAMKWNPCHGIFDHKWLDPYCVERGCVSLRGSSQAGSAPAEPSVGLGLHDPETAEYPVLVRAYLAVETALAKRILADRNRVNRERGEPRNWPAQQEWDELGQTSHETFWSAARKEAGLPTEGAFKNEVILGAGSAGSPEPSDKAIQACATVVIGGLPESRRADALWEDWRKGLRAAYAVDRVNTSAGNASPEWLAKIADEMGPLVVWIQEEQGSVGWVHQLNVWQERIRNYVRGASSPSSGEPSTTEPCQGCDGRPWTQCAACHGRGYIVRGGSSGEGRAPEPPMDRMP